jgi:hypothetical protein
VAPVAALAHELGQHGCPLVRGQVAEGGARLVLRDGSRLEEERREQLILASLHRQQPHLGPGVLVAAGAVEAEPPRPALGGLGALLEVLDPLAATVGTLHAGHEARDHGLQLLEDHARVGTRLGKRRAEQPQEQLLVRLAGSEDPDVRER